MNKNSDLSEAVFDLTHMIEDYRNELDENKKTYIKNGGTEVEFNAIR